ncbi:MAG: hypothetical protein ACUZ8H_15690 [Candidatus Anammoxibacter sp.]
MKRCENAISSYENKIQFRKDDKEGLKDIPHFKSLINGWEEQITELKADIKKL